MPSGTRSERCRYRAEDSAVTGQDGLLGGLCLTQQTQATADARPHGGEASARAAARALAAVLEIQLHVLVAVIDGDFGARGDIFHRAKHHAASAQHGFRIWIARVVDIAGDIAARRAVDGPAAIDLKQIAVAAVLRLLGRL